MFTPGTAAGLTNFVFIEKLNRNFAEIPSLLEKDCITYATVQELFKHFEGYYKSHEEIPDDSLIALDSIFGETLEKALELIDTNSVTYFHTNSKTIGVFQVEGSLHNSYIIFPCINYCPCLAYKYQVAGGPNLMCKHVLATIVAKIIGKVKLLEITPSQLYNLLLNAACINGEDWPNQHQFIEQPMCPQPEIPQPFSQSNNWVHVPPQTMPWGLPSNAHPDVVRFTAGDFISQHYPVKRKLDPDPELPSKQLVTEEKMAAHMSNLHISDVEVPSHLNTDEEAMETDRLPKLFMCDEVKNIKADPVIPESILNKIERPTMAVVLWQPTANDLSKKLAEIKNAKGKEKEEKDDTAMIVENNNIETTFRPIDPVPMHAASQNRFLQPTPQFHGYFPFS